MYVEFGSLEPDCRDIGECKGFDKECRSYSLHKKIK